MKTQATNIGVLVVTHGRLAEELVAAAGVIVGKVDHLSALSIGWNDDVDEAREIVRQAIRGVDRGHGVLVLTDMFGGTPTNLSLSFLAAGSVEIITGVNLPMVVKTANLGKEIAAGMSLRQVAETVAGKGRESVKVAGELMDPEGGEGVIEREFRIVNKRGLHARAAARFVHLASTFESEVIVAHETEEADGKSILSLMVLGAGPGTTVRIKTSGPDETKAIEELGALIGGGFEEHD